MQLQTTFSAAARWEMQLWVEMYALIPSPQGRPNIVLPVPIALPSDEEDDQTRTTRQIAMVVLEGTEIIDKDGFFPSSRPAKFTKIVCFTRKEAEGFYYWSALGF